MVNDFVYRKDLEHYFCWVFSTTELSKKESYDKSTTSETEENRSIGKMSPEKMSKKIFFF